MKIESFPVDSPLRLEGIGGSEAGTALGVNPFCSTVELYQIKIGELINDVKSDAAELGHVLEPWILDKYEQKYNVKLERPGDIVYRHPAYSWLFAHVDGLIIGEKKGVDAKSTGLMNYQAAKNFGKSGTDQVPQSIICQCVLYMAIFDYPQWDVAALIAGGGVRFYQVYRDLDLEKIVIDKLKKFWFENVKKRIPPEPKSVEDVELIYSSGDQGSIESNPKIYKAYLELLKARKKCAEATEEKKKSELIIKKYMSDYGLLVDFNDKEMVTWFKDTDSEKFDNDSFMENEPDMYKKYLVPKIGCRRFLPKKFKKTG